MRDLNINLKNTSYKIIIEDGLLNNISKYIKEVYKNKKIFILTDDNVEKLYLNTVISYLQQNSIPNDFYRYNTLVNTISDLKKQRDKLVNFKNWIVNSNKDYDSLISKFELQSVKLPTGRIKQRTTVVR